MKSMRELMKLTEGVMAVPALGEKSSSEKQARFMAAAAHDSSFAKKAGIDQSVAKEFNKADKGTELLSRSTEHIKENEEWESLVEEMRTYIEEYMAHGVSFEDAVNEIYKNTSSDYAITALDQAMHDMKKEGVAEAHVDTCRHSNPAPARDACAMEGVDFSDPDSWDMKDLVAAFRSGEIDNKTYETLLAQAIASDDGYTDWSMRQGEAGLYSPAIAEGELQEEAGPVVHTFPDSGSAYDATQMGEWYDESDDSVVEVKNGDILLIPSEGVVGICTTWPLAITENSGKLHKIKPEYATPEGIAKVTKLPVENVIAAFKTAQELGFNTVGDIKEDLNNGYNDLNMADSQDFFPTGADGPVVKKVGPSGARQGDNPEQKSMQISEEHKELVYAYRKFLKESGISKTQKKLSESEKSVADVEVLDYDIDVSSDTDLISARGSISVSATVPDVKGQEREIKFDVWIEASSDIEWETEESPSGWNYATDNPTYTTYSYASSATPQFQSIEFNKDGIFMVDDAEVSLQRFQQSIQVNVLRYLLSPSFYVPTIDKLFRTRTEKIKQDESDHRNNRY